MPDNWSALIAFYSAWKLGHLPCAGGLMDQPAVYLETMHLIAGELGKIEAAAVEDARKKR
jgi:hypothetical protein